MEIRLSDERQMRAYLLGTLDAAEVISMDTRFLADQECRLAFWEAEAHLIEDYLRNRLAGADRAAFQQNYLSTLRNQENVSLIAGLISRQEPRASVLALTQTRHRRTWLVAASLVALVLAGAFSVWREVRKQTAQSGATAQQRDAAALRSKLFDAQAKLRAFEQNKLAVFSVGQMVRGVSGESSAPIVIPSGASEITLLVPRDIDLPDPHKATLYAEGATSRTAIASPQLYVSPHSPFALAYIQAEILPPGNYQLAIDGQRSISFRISQK